MILHDYFSSSGKNLILKYIDNLTEDEQEDAHFVRRVMREGRFEKISPKPWQGKIYEVYFRRHNRMFYIIINNDIYILHACRKQKNRTEKTDSDLILKRARELEQRFGKKFI